MRMSRSAEHCRGRPTLTLSEKLRNSLILLNEVSQYVNSQE